MRLGRLLTPVTFQLGQLPGCPQTLQDFGFDRCAEEDRDGLLRVYRLMFIYPGLAAPVLQKWRVSQAPCFLNDHFAA